jgi:lysophospholipase L1-like esterase
MTVAQWLKNSAAVGRQALKGHLGAGDIGVERATYVGLSKFHRWKLKYNGLLPIPDVMALPPTISIGAAAAVSSINSSTTPGYSKDDVRMTRLGGTFEDSGNYKRGSRGGVRYRWIMDGTRFDFRVRSYLGQGQFTILVDGKPVSKALFSEEHPGLGDDTEHFVLVDFGNDTQTYALVNPVILSGGSGHAVGDILTQAGGSFSTAAQIRVTSVNAGVITGAAIHVAGSYTVAPATTTQGSTTGSGTGATFTTAFGKLHTTKKVRFIEIILGFGVRFGGINVDTGVSVLPWAENTEVAKLLIAGDSLAQGFFDAWAGGNLTRQIAYKLGLEERFVQYGTSGRGYLKNTLFSLDTPGIIALAPDMLGIFLGINDMFNSGNTSAAAVQAEVTARINELLTALPKVRIVAVGPYYDTTSGKVYSLAVGAGIAAASDQTRVRYYDLAATSAYSASGAWCSTDNTHPPQAGQDFLAAILAPVVANSFLSMT